MENITLCSPRPSAVSESLTTPTLVSTIVDSKKLPLNHIIIRVHYFGFSANNITYQALGEHPHFRYFDYHTAPSSTSHNVSPKTHGLIPVWGFGTIEASTHPKLSVGERVYGYFAPVRYLVLPISSNDVNKFAAYVSRPHLPRDRRPYNQILRCASDPQYNPAHEELTMLYRPLFWTSFWFEDYLHTTLPNYSTISGQSRKKHINFLISSASSKTAFCLAYLIRSRIRQTDRQTRIVGLTSATNIGFTKGLKLYTDVFPYDTDLMVVLNDNSGWWVYVDVAGNTTLNNRLETYFDGGSTRRSQLVKAVSLGLTNLSPISSEGSTKEWNPNTFSSTSSPTTTTTTTTSRTIELEQFFMPEWLSHRQRQLPLQDIVTRQKIAWDRLIRDCQPWVTLERICGPGNVQKAYTSLLRSGVGPEKGWVWSMWSEDEGDGQMVAKL